MTCRHQFPPKTRRGRRGSPRSRLDADRRRRLELLDGAHLMFSSAFVRQNASDEIVATMKKMIIATALASP